MSCQNRLAMKDYIDRYHDLIKIGKIVSVFDLEHPEYMDELFFVIGFQQSFNGDSQLVALMDHQCKTFVTDINNVVLKSLLTIDDMFPPKYKLLHTANI